MPRIGNVCKGKHKRRSSCSDLEDYSPEDSSMEESALILAGISRPMKPFFPCEQPCHTKYYSGSYNVSDSNTDSTSCSKDTSNTDSQSDCSCKDTEYSSNSSCSATDSGTGSYTTDSSQYNWDTEDGSTIYIENCNSKCSSGGYSSSTYCSCTDSSCSYCKCSGSSTKGYSKSCSRCNCTEGFCTCSESEISETSGTRSAAWCSTATECSDTSGSVFTVSEMEGNNDGRHRPTHVTISSGRHMYDRTNLPRTIFVAGTPQNAAAQNASAQIILRGEFPISTSVTVKSMGNTRVMIFPRGNKMESFDMCGNIVVGGSPYNISGTRGSVTLSFMPGAVWGIMNLFRGVIAFAR